MLNTKLSDVPGYGNYYVGYLDILGFKNRVTEAFDKDDRRLFDTMFNTFHRLPNYLTGRTTPAVQATESTRSEEKDIKWRYASYVTGGPEERLPNKEFINKIVDSADYFSDTILFYIEQSLDDKERRDQLFSICYLMNYYMKMLILEPPIRTTYQVPFRGAIASGKAVMNPELKIYFGKPIIDACTTAESLNWLGAVLHDSVHDTANLTDLSTSEDNDYLVGFNGELYEYNAIPIDRLKNEGSPRIKYTLNWVRHFPAAKTLPDGKQLYGRIEKRKPLARDVIYHLIKNDWNGLTEKRANTIRYAAHICDRYASSKKYEDAYSNTGKHFLEGSYRSFGIPFPLTIRTSIDMIHWATSPVPHIQNKCIHP